MSHETLEVAEVADILAGLSSPSDEELVQALRGNSERAIAIAAAQGGGGGAPSGVAGGVLAGTYPDPSFAVDMATQAELDAVAATISAGGFTLIETIYFAADGASADFQSIPDDFEHLELRWRARSAGADGNVRLRFNNDSAGNYDYNLLAGVNNSAAASATGGQTSLSLGEVPNSGHSANYFGAGRCGIPGYKRTVGWRSTESVWSDIRGSGAGDYVSGANGGLWHNTAAVTRVTVFMGSGNILAGSVFSLYGIS